MADPYNRVGQGPMDAVISDTLPTLSGTLHRPGGPIFELVLRLEASEGTPHAPDREEADRVGAETESITCLTRKAVAGT